MIKWTTPTIKCTIPNDLIFEYIILTLRQSNIKVEKRVNFEDVTDGVFYAHFEQKDTSKFNKEYKVKAQLNIMHGDTRLATNIIELKMGENLHDELL